MAGETDPPELDDKHSVQWRGPGAKEANAPWGEMHRGTPRGSGSRNDLKANTVHSIQMYRHSFQFSECLPFAVHHFQTYIQTDTQTDIETYIQTDTDTDRQTDSQTTKYLSHGPPKSVKRKKRTD